MADPPQVPRTQTVETHAHQQVGCVLRVLEGEDAGKSLDLPEGRAVVGTRDDCELRLTDPTVSGRHVEVAITPAGLRVRDLESRNGTFYLDGRLNDATLPVGAVVRLGRTRLALASRQPAAGPLYSDATSY